MYYQLKNKGFYLVSYKITNGYKHFHFSTDQKKASYFFKTDLVLLTEWFPELYAIQYLKNGLQMYSPAKLLVKNNLTGLLGCPSQGSNSLIID